MRIIFLTLSGLTLVVAIIALLPIFSDSMGAAYHRKYLPEKGTLVSISSERMLNTYETGQGNQAIILVHGVPGSGHMMQPLARALVVEGFRVVTYDRLGWAHSTRRPRNEMADPSNNARDLNALIKSLGVRDPILIGYSYGGGVVQELNRMTPELPQCNVLIASNGNGRKRGTQGLVSSLIFSEPVMNWTLSFTPLALQASEPSMQALFYPAEIIENERMSLVAVLDASVETWLRESRERFIEFESFSPEKITQPTLIIHGAEDQIVGIEIAKRLHKDIKKSRLHLLDGVGHAIALTHATEVAKLVTSFVNNCKRQPGHISGTI